MVDVSEIATLPEILIHSKMSDFRYTMKSKLALSSSGKFEIARTTQTSGELFGASGCTLSAHRSPWRTLRAPKEQL